jgi:hypothetical protein
MNRVTAENNYNSYDNFLCPNSLKFQTTNGQPWLGCITRRKKGGRMGKKELTAFVICEQVII